MIMTHLTSLNRPIEPVVAIELRLLMIHGLDIWGKDVRRRARPRGAAPTQGTAVVMAATGPT
jgi:hypothetical protein